MNMHGISESFSSALTAQPCTFLKFLQLSIFEILKNVSILENYKHNLITLKIIPENSKFLVSKGLKKIPRCIK